MIRVIVSGAAGKMGREVVKAVTAEPDMVVVAAVDPVADGTALDDGSGSYITCGQDLREAIHDTSPDVMVDFTRPDVVLETVGTAIAAGVDCVVGTTGVAADPYRDLLADAPNGTSVLVAPNFAIGAVLLMRFAQEAARYLPDAEIVELHHSGKADAPSGTSLRTAALIAAARTDVTDVPGRETEIVPGARGALVDGVPVHSIRLPGLVAHQEVLFGGQGQTLSVRHDSIDRTSFMPGVVLAIRASAGLSGLVIGLESLLED
jgi:4-hydroxy-tetrahydrodipicolinate reductase